MKREWNDGPIKRRLAVSAARYPQRSLLMLPASEQHTVRLENPEIPLSLLVSQP